MFQHAIAEHGDVGIWTVLRECSLKGFTSVLDDSNVVLLAQQGQRFDVIFDAVWKREYHSLDSSLFSISGQLLFDLLSRRAKSFPVQIKGDRLKSVFTTSHDLTAPLQSNQFMK